MSAKGRKTYAYLTACVMMQKFYLKNWNVPAQPVVISTSSIALQNAVMKEYIPFLSRVFLKHHILSEPIRAVVWKGKERFVCDIRLFQWLYAVREKKKPTNLDALKSLVYHYDLDCVNGMRSQSVRKGLPEKESVPLSSIPPRSEKQGYFDSGVQSQLFVSRCRTSI